jgi:anti-sigma factor RsiW
MSPRDSVDPERSRRLMMAALDGEISPEEQRELDRVLETDSEVREEWERMSRVKEVTSTMVMREPPEEVWEQYWTSVYNRTERGIGWVLFSLGSIVLLGYGAWKWAEAIFQTEDLPFLPKAAILGVALGLSILVVSVIREKLFTKTRDPYKEVKR